MRPGEPGGPGSPREPRGLEVLLAFKSARRENSQPLPRVRPDSPAACPGQGTRTSGGPGATSDARNPRHPDVPEAGRIKERQGRGGRGCGSSLGQRESRCGGALSRAELGGCGAGRVGAVRPEPRWGSGLAGGRLEPRRGEEGGGWVLEGAGAVPVGGGGLRHPPSRRHRGRPTAWDFIT